MTNIFLKAEQHSSMEAVYNGHDVFMWLPTGCGKSLCNQALPFIMDFQLGVVGSNKCLVLVVSPLVALMVEQVTSLRKRSVNCSMVTSSMASTRTFYVATGNSLSTDSLLFCTPEALVRSKWRYILRAQRDVILHHSFYTSPCILDIGCTSHTYIRHSWRQI